jgi:hypothetical protein
MDGDSFYQKAGVMHFGNRSYLPVYGLAVSDNIRITIINIIFNFIYYYYYYYYLNMLMIGLQEQRTMHLEAGLPCFPYDYPGTPAYQQWSRGEAAMAQERYEKRPPAKRPNYTKFLVEHPFDPPFFMLTTNVVTSTTTATNQQSPLCFVLPRPVMKQWLAKAPTTQSNNNNNDNNNELDTITETNMNIDHQFYRDISAILLTRVRLRMLTRGVVHRNAIIYGFDVVTLIQQLPNTTVASSINWHKLSASLDIDGVSGLILIIIIMLVVIVLTNYIGTILYSLSR